MFVVPKTARSWVNVDPSSHFSIQNLPFAIFAPLGREVTLATAIGDYVVDITVLRDAGLVSEKQFPFLDSFADLTQDEFTALRKVLFELLEESNPVFRDNEILRLKALIQISRA